jgi:hypothetical protein
MHIAQAQAHDGRGQDRGDFLNNIALEVDRLAVTDELLSKGS